MEIGNSGVQVMRHICYVILNCNNTRMREKIYSLIACLCVCDCVIFWLTHEFVCSFTFVRSLFVHSLLVRALIHRRRKSDVRRFVRVNINLFFSGQSLANCATSGNIINTINVTSINIIINHIISIFPNHSFDRRKNLLLRIIFLSIIYPFFVSTIISAMYFINIMIQIDHEYTHSMNK